MRYWRSDTKSPQKQIQVGAAAVVAAWAGA